jgi:hypothetical protein
VRWGPGPGAVIHRQDFHQGCAARHGNPACRFQAGTVGGVSDPRRESSCTSL